jgi:hypothetical protein
MMCSKVQARNFTTLVYSVLLNAGKTVLKKKETLWKNNLIIAKNVRIIPVNFTVIAIIFSEKKLKALFLNHPSYLC